MQFLNYESPLMTTINKIVDYVLLGLLWLVASVLLFTSGAATTAMYYTAQRSIHEHCGRLFTTFWSQFCKEFKQATVLWLIGLLLTATLVLNGILLWRVQLHGIVYALLLVTVLLGTGWMLLWYGYLSKFQDDTAAVLLNTFRIALSCFPKILLLMLILIATIAGAVVSALRCFPVLLLIPGIYAWLSGAVLRSIFKPYLPETDDTESV